MILSQLSIDEALEKAKEYKYVLVYEISSMFFGEQKDMPEINIQQCKEAFFFDNAGEIHIFETDNGLNSVEFVEETKDCFVEKEYASRKFKGIGNAKVLVREYLEPDSDGQMCVKYSRITEVK